MAQWTVALFGHYKPHNIGWERRAIPGDIIAFKPFEDEYKWTDTERKQFLIVTIDGPDAQQMVAMAEPFWDTESYRVYNPDEELKAFKKSDPIYRQLLSMLKDKCQYPTTTIKKRRMFLTESMLESMGVDLDKMFDKEFYYNPKLPVIKHTDCFDKLNDRNIVVTDGLNIIQPLTDAAIEAKKV